MAMCPYCGEEVDDDAAQCWKCGASIAADASDDKTDSDDGGLAVPDDDDEDGGLALPDDIDDDVAKSKPKVQVRECPHCNAPMPKKLHRCKECGRMMEEWGVDESDARAWKMGSWGVILAVTAIAALGFIFLVMPSGDVERVYVTYKFSQLDSLVGRRSRDANRRNQTWEKIDGKFIVWEGMVVERIDGLTDTTFLVKIDPSNAKDLPDVKVTFPSSTSDKVKLIGKDQSLRFDARLLRPGEDEKVVFVMDHADLPKEEGTEGN